MYSQSVIPFYTRNKTTKKWHSVGSGILIVHQQQHMVVTAAHVVETLQKCQQSYLYIDQKLCEIGRLPFYTSPSGLFGSRQSDPLDIGVLPLPQVVMADFPNATFIQQCDCQHHHLETPFYQIVGYPHARNTKLANRTANIKGQFRTEMLALTVAKAPIAAYEPLTLSSDHHLVVELSKTGLKPQSTEPHTISDLKGTSGGLLQMVMRYNVASDSVATTAPAGMILGRDAQRRFAYALQLNSLFSWLDMHLDYIFADWQSIA